MTQSLSGNWFASSKKQTNKKTTQKLSFKPSKHNENQIALAQCRLMSMLDQLTEEKNMQAQF